MTTPDYTPYVEYARRQAARRREQAAARYEEAWIVARQIADFLRREYRPARIVAFGSLVHPEIFGLHSDIDIAVDGIPWPEYLRTWNTEFSPIKTSVPSVSPWFFCKLMGCTER